MKIEDYEWRFLYIGEGNRYYAKTIKELGKVCSPFIKESSYFNSKTWYLYIVGKGYNPIRGIPCLVFEKEKTNKSITFRNKVVILTNETVEQSIRKWLGSEVWVEVI